MIFMKSGQKSIYHLNNFLKTLAISIFGGIIITVYVISRSELTAHSLVLKEAYRGKS